MFSTIRQTTQSAHGHKFIENPWIHFLFWGKSHQSTEPLWLYVRSCKVKLRRPYFRPYLKKYPVQEYCFMLNVPHVQQAYWKSRSQKFLMNNFSIALVTARTSYTSQNRCWYESVSCRWKICQAQRRYRRFRETRWEWQDRVFHSIPWNICR